MSSLKVALPPLTSSQSRECLLQFLSFYQGAALSAITAVANLTPTSETKVLTAGFPKVHNNDVSRHGRS